ncbi:MAG: PAS domain-containing sensor histidine kinase [Herpetosiphonaceae bacterium]|nr:PAS domain-containing sensor histidine kinase [Herpetosiphonaceae bacterium]
MTSDRESFAPETDACPERERTFRTFVEAIPQIVWTATPEGGLDYYNQRWCDYTGMTLEQTLGWGWQPVLHPDDLQQCLDCWTQAVTTGEPYEVEYRFKRASDGLYRWHLGRALPARNAEGQIMKWFGTCTDIDDQKRAEAALRELQHQLEQLVAVRTQALEAKTDEQESFVYTVAHDLKAPLVSLQALATLLIEEYAAQLDPKAQGYLERINVNVSRMHLLMDELLELSRIGRVDVEMSCVQLDGLVQQTLEQLRDTLVARRAEVAIVGRLPVVWANPARVTQIFMHLIDNAVQYTPRERVPRIQITSADNGNSWEVVVRDNGTGIPVAFRSKIFEPFQRLPSGKALYPQGTGIGLTIVARIVAALSGKLWIDSEEGVGTALHFTLPKPMLAEQVNE